MYYPSVPQQPVRPAKRSTGIWFVWTWIGVLVVSACICGVAVPGDDPPKREPNRLVNPSPTVPTRSPTSEPPSESATPSPTPSLTPSATPSPTPTTPAPVTPRATTPAPRPPRTTAPAGGSTYYANCAAVRAAKKAPLYRGQPGFRPGLDRDNDGIACET